MIIIIILFKLILWGLGIGDWGLGIGPNPQSPIPNPQSPLRKISNFLYFLFYQINSNIIRIDLNIKKNEF